MISNKLAYTSTLVYNISVINLERDDIMQKKLCFFDIDNTILDHFCGGIVPESTLKALKMLKENGHIVGIASGKGANYIETFIPEFPFDSYVALNGNYVKLNGEVIFQDTVPKDVLNRFIDYCTENDFAFMVGDIDGTKTTFKNDPRIKAYYDVFHMAYPKMIDDFHNLKDVYQMTIAITEDQEELVLPLFPELTFARMNKYGMNVNPGGGLKEKGLAKLLELTGYTKDDLVVFGDGLNDIGMFKLASTSVAMGNADPLLKKYASYITDFVSDDGIYKACLKLNLIYKK